ncbi:DNA-binding response regulator, OmpR family, contains REC and winged-helix (wHTH) domain [Dethiosulfatibacter aminovorans DSM 17477]|uniref:DNA-binding response regulator, OmpR family, contains REC and winged-helix (WHTH) domain n=1 Tax=Dethiosulfatibacter aminovorans DSM 17477 TaxID=1121476 RepID=A0A1M6MYD5_9FIRM|nr:response regulator transcription factor [Dethiosulfatibacter aminovorans]SHJ88424.1 DNA-binding response regulator, OmpR family, contains REC and winged-helix (wHTH) domain [Dethiosulfatibacter aminovorans DSM 17477]
MDNKVVLVVDDDKDIRNMIKIYLQNDNYDVVLAKDGNEALEILEGTKVDLVVLDIMMPGMDGMETCMKIRENHRMPIIFLSAKGEDMDKIMGLSAGGDDYLTKPFNPMELTARVKANIRRVDVFDKIESESDKEDTITIDDLTINVDTHQVFYKDEEIHLTKTEFDILKLLASNRGMVFSIEKIYNKVWKDEFFVTDNTVTVHIRKLREKLKDDYKNPKYIKTIWGVGYKIEK